MNGLKTTTEEQALVEMFFKVRDAAYEIISKKGATYYGIAVTLARICRAILDDEKAIFPPSVYLDGEYGQSDLYIGAPAILGREGVVSVIEIPLNDSELDKMNASASTLKAVTADGFARLEEN